MSKESQSCFDRNAVSKYVVWNVIDIDASIKGKIKI